MADVVEPLLDASAAAVLPLVLFPRSHIYMGIVIDIVQGLNSSKPTSKIEGPPGACRSLQK